MDDAVADGMSMAAAGPPRLRLFQSLWGFSGTLDQAITRAKGLGFDGLEANLRHPALCSDSPHVVRQQLHRDGLELIVELVTGGDYVPDLSRSWQQHVAELDAQLCQAEALQPTRISVITGSDSWDDAMQDEFLNAVLARIDSCGIAVSLETHRSRSLYNPWRLAQLVQQHPGLRLTADISHWCAVSERLMTPELTPIAAIADRVDHIHARVGHAQGPSVSHPFAPEWADALEAHRRCWQLFVQRQRARGQGVTTITPEFGPDGYLPSLPYTAMPVADLDAINTAIAQWLRQGALEC
jgi:sugar phosphate isomerase/epimerase